MNQNKKAVIKVVDYRVENIPIFFSGGPTSLQTGRKKKSIWLDLRVSSSSSVLANTCIVLSKMSRLSAISQSGSRNSSAFG